MKRIKRLLIISIMMLFPVVQIYAAGISVSTSNLSINVGSSKTFTIKASSAAGRVDISSSNTSVATVSSSNKFLDNSSAKITVKGKKEGTAKITIKLTDVATYDGKVLTGTKTITVTVKKPVEKVVVPKEMSITKFEVVGYDLKFKPDVMEYEINVDKNVKSLYILIEGKNYTASGNKVVNIENKDSINVTLKDDKVTNVYKIKLNKTTNESSKVVPIEQPKDPEVKTVTVEKEVVNNKYLYTTVALGVLSFILLILYLTKKPKTKNEPINQTPTVNSNVAYQPNNNFNINPTQYNNNQMINKGK